MARERRRFGYLRAMQPKLFVAALITLILQACLLPQGAPPTDPAFANMRVSYETQLRAELRKVDVQITNREFRERV